MRKTVHKAELARLSSFLAILWASMMWSGCGGASSASGPVTPASKSARDSSQLIYVLNQQNVTVHSVPGGPATLTIQNGVLNPTAAAVDPSGNLYIANAGNDTVTVYAPGQSTITRTIKAGILHPSHLVFDGSGNLYVANDGKYGGFVTEYAQGAMKPERKIVGDFHRIAALALDKQGNVYISVRERGARKGFVAIVVPTATSVTQKRTSGLFSPRGIAVDMHGILYVANEYGGNGVCTHGCVQEYALGSSEPLRTLSGITGPYAVAVDPVGEFLYVVSADQFTVFATGGTSELKQIFLTGGRSLAFDGDDNLWAAVGGSPARIIGWRPGLTNEVGFIEHDQGVRMPIQAVLSPVQK